MAEELFKFHTQKIANQATDLWNCVVILENGGKYNHRRGRFETYSLTKLDRVEDHAQIIAQRLGMNVPDFDQDDPEEFFRELGQFIWPDISPDSLYPKIED